MTIKLQRKSNAHLVICRLVHLGGTAKLSQLIGVLGVEYKRPAKLQATVIDVLLDYGYVTRDRDVLIATQAGKDYAGATYDWPLPVAEKYVGLPAAPRVRTSNGVLNLNKIHPKAVYREGAFEHRNIPSLMGNTRKLPSGEVVE